MPAGADPAELNGHGHGDDGWVEILARSVAHMAAQLTINQIRLRALATELTERDLVSPESVARRVHSLAASETGVYLRENLGESLTEIVDVETLEQDLIAYLQDDSATEG